MSSEGRFDVLFNEMLDEKLGGLLDLPIEETRKGIQELRILLQKRNQRRRLSLTDEISLMPAEMRCMVFQNFTNSKLIDTIIAYPDFESTAGYVLQRRKNAVHLDVCNDRNCYSTDRELSMDCEMYKKKKGNDEFHDEEVVQSKISKKLRFSSDLHLSDYFCGFLRVILLFMTSSELGIEFNSVPCPTLEPENYFGAPATDFSDKFKLKGHLNIRSEVFAPLLQWICPSWLTYNADPKLLFDCRGELMIDGVEYLRIDWNSPVRIWSDVIEKCKAKNIRMGSNAFWSRRSFCAVLTEHANSGEGGVARVIEIGRLRSKEDWAYCSQETDDEFPARFPRFVGWSLNVWVERFKSWRTGHIAKFGKPEHDVTYEVETERGQHTFILTLH